MEDSKIIILIFGAVMENENGSIGLWDAISIGIGGMVGAGIFSVLGVAAQIAGIYVYISFLIAGIVAALCAYSFAKLGSVYPSSGGPVEFLVQGFGDSVFTGGLNIMLLIGYIFAIALYAAAFAFYTMAFFPDLPEYWFNILASGIVLLFMLVNAIGSKAVGRSEMFIVAVKVGILLFFAFIGLSHNTPVFSDASMPPSITGILFASGMVFISYEGFGLITNTAGDMKNVKKTLPLALYISVAVVIIIYLLVAITLTSTLSIPEIEASEDYALAEAAMPILGAVGFKLIGIAALFSTASAINATLYGGSNVSYNLAKHGELPERFEKHVWRDSREGLFITTGIVLVFVNLINLGEIAMVGSSMFLLIYMVVCIVHFILRKETNGNVAIIVASIVGCLATFGVLVYYIFQEDPMVLVLLFGVIILLKHLISFSVYLHAEEYQQA